MYRVSGRVLNQGWVWLAILSLISDAPPPACLPSKYGIEVWL